MNTLFIQLLNMSIAASWIVLAVLLLRMVLKSAPKAIRCILWAIVGVRLICPFSFESILSLIPSAQTVPPEIVYAAEPSIHSGIPALNSAVNPVLSGSLAPKPWESVNPMQIALFVGEILWVIGIFGMILYAVISVLSIRRKVREAVALRENIWICDRIDTPFIFGVFQPRIYLPSAMNEADMEYVIAHEKAHLKRKDHWWKPLGWLLLTVYWFNPILWLAYVLLCRDIELACDEKVIKERGEAWKKPYSEALVHCSVSRHAIAACPLAFGESEVKGRIRAVLHYRKPTFWLILVAALSCLALGICFLTNPIEKKPSEMGVLVTNYGTTCPDVKIEVSETGVFAKKPYIKVRMINEQEKEISYGEAFALFRGKEDLTADSVWHLLGYSLKGYGSVDLTFDLSRFDVSVPGVYRLEKVFEIPQDGQPRYTAYVDFVVSEEYAIVGKTYEGERLVYSDGMYSSVFYDNQIMLRFAVTEDLQLQTDEIFSETQKEGAWIGLGSLQSVDLNKDNFYALLTDHTWEDGYSVQALRRENYAAWSVKNEALDRMAYVLLQENGDVYICYGYSARPSLRWVFKMCVEGTNSKSAVGGAEWKEQAMVYTYTGSPESVPPQLCLHEKDHTFTLRYSTLSSFVPTGTYELTDAYLILTTDQLYEQTYTFKREGDRYIFDASKSQTIPQYRYEADGEYQSPMPDGAVFERVK